MKKTAFLPATLCAVLILASSCGSSEVSETPSQGTGATVADTAAETETAAIDSIGSLKDLDFGGEHLTIDISVNTDEWNTSSVYVMGADEEVGDEAKDAVYRRNMQISDALNLQIDWITSDLSFSSVYNYISKPVLSGDCSVDMYINDQYGLVRCMTSGCLYNIADIPEESNYFDFSADGWYKEYMDELSILPDHDYFLVGDYFMDVLRGTHVLYFNKNLMASMYDGADALYQTVLDGTWTYDVLISYLKDCYQDLNMDGSRDKDDLYGVRLHTDWSGLYMNTTDCATVSKEADGTLVLDPTVDRFSALADKLIEVYSSNGYCNMPDGEGTTERINYFVSGQVLFAVWLKIADMETDEMRNMDGVGMIPYPKLDESQDGYRTLVHDVAEIGAVPLTVNEDHLGALSAYLQAMTQYTEEYVMPTYFETALKVKYTQDEQSAQMLDIIRDGIRCPFEYAFKDNFASVGVNPLGASIRKKTNVVASTVEKGMSKAQKELDKLNDAMAALD